MLVLSGLGSATDRERADMSLFQRAHDIVAAKADKALDAAEKPDEMLDYSYNQMLEQITRIRRALVDIAASRKQIELQETQLQHSIDHLNDQAKTALAQGREDLAREALSRKGAAQAQIDGLEPQHQQLTEEEQKLEQGLAQLQQRVNNFRSQKEVLKAQYTAASAMNSVNEDAAGISTSVSDSGAALERAQDKISTMQARAGALDELLQSGVLEDVGGGGDDIQKELARPLFDAGREEVHDLGDAGGADLRSAGSRVDPTEIRLAVELRQRVEERPGGRVGGEGSRDVLGQIGALGTFRRQLDAYFVAGCHGQTAHPRRAQGERPSGFAGRERHPDPGAVDGAVYMVHGLGAPRLVGVERNHDNRATVSAVSDQGTEPLSSHVPHRGTTRAARGTEPLAIAWRRLDKCSFQVSLHRRRLS
jgi:phage shock protein A